MGFYLGVIGGFGLLVLLCGYPLQFEIWTKGDWQQQRLSWGICWLPLGPNCRFRVSFVQKEKTGSWLRQQTQPRDQLKKRQKKRYQNKAAGRWWGELLKALGVRSLSAEVELGCGDAALTALGVGAAQMTVAVGLGVLSYQFRAFPKAPRWRVRPIFGQKQILWQADCILVTTWGILIYRMAMAALKTR